MRTLGIILIFLVCCAPVENETLKQASNVHNEAIEIGHSTSLLVSKLKQQEASLSTAEQDTLQSLMKSLSEWYDTVVEVPGYDHEEDDHGHGHDHDHDHHDHGEELNYLEGLSPEEVLAVQQALKGEIERIQGRTLQFSKAIKSSN